MTTWVAGTEESTTGDTGGTLPGRGATAASAARQPAGEWHAIDLDARRPACGTQRFLEVWPDLAWSDASAPSRCAACLEAVPV